ncbi:MAG: YdbH domain-containing protein [Sphingomonadales bacterium]|nr:YdbH domain-containing protein [Sphingomonadales bacterium]MBD3775015.1 YdbH domain-containing protein [Paracoccaceae bacterium]
MAEADSNDAAGGTVRSRRPRVLHALLAVLALVLLALGMAWSQREQIAGNVIESQLKSLGLPASYRITRIAPDRQVLEDIVIGDPARPDMTIERAEVALHYGFGAPSIGRVTLVKPRLYGSLHDGKLSFGSLDPLIFPDQQQSSGLPDLDLALEDGRALIESDYGPIGLKAEGSGNLSGGFSGILAATAPRLEYSGCDFDRATLYGKISTAGGKPKFSGPLRLARMECAGGGAMANAAFTLDAAADKALAAYDVGLAGTVGRASYGVNRAGATKLTLRGAWRDQRLTGTYRIEASDIATPQARMAGLALDGSLRAADGFSQIGTELEIAGEGIAPGRDLDATLAGLQASAADTLAGPMIAKLRAVLAREAPGSSLAASMNLRKTGEVTKLVVPQANWRGGSGATLVALSRVSLTAKAGATPLISGNIGTGGELPRITGRMERMASGRLALNMAMAPYTAGDGTLAVPELVMVQDRGGAIGFSGRVQVSGPLPGGYAERLRLPISGNWSSARGLSLWRECIDVAFDRLDLSQVRLLHRGVKLCPGSSGAILRYDRAGLRIAAGTPALALDGTLAGTPLTVRSGAVGFAYPGNLYARALDVTLGRADNAARFRLTDVEAVLGGDIVGRFAGTDAKLDAVPLDILGAQGNWRYAGGVLTLSDASFQLADRQQPARFETLQAQGATLTLENNAITADTILREPKTQREVSAVHVVHDLSSGRGSARLDVPGLLFDKALQPDELSYLAKGFVANARGTITGSGTIAWDGSGVTSSRGSFSTDDFDLAAAFGPVQGISGTVNFSDLLGMTTEPDQQLRIASVNPGIEARDGIVTFSLTGGQVLALREGSWPFLGGKLDLQPVDLDFSKPGHRRYVIELSGVDAALFVQQMELSNISASGIFDGALPLEFDEMGNGSIVGGRLVSRAPGGNVSYVGQLTYEDLSPMANYAFDALKSLNYRQMTIDMDGPLTGYIVSSVQFEGISQGEGASKNYVTRQLAKLPIQFNINIRAKFYDLIRNVRSLYDPAFMRDPRDVGLQIDGLPAKTQQKSPGETQAEPPIQDQASESKP